MFHLYTRQLTSQKQLPLEVTIPKNICRVSKTWLNFLIFPFFVLIGFYTQVPGNVGVL